MRTAMVVAAVVVGVALVGALAAATVFVCSATSLYVFMLQVIGGGA